MCLLLLGSVCGASTLLFSSVFPLSRGPRSWKGIRLGEPIWTDQRDIPYHIASCSLVKHVGSVFWRKQLLKDWMSIRRLWFTLHHLFCFLPSSLFKLLNCFYRETVVIILFFLCCSYSLPPCQWGRMGVNPPQTATSGTAGKGRDSELSTSPTIMISH